MKGIHQLVHTLSYGDAISGEVLALQRCLRHEGIESEIYAINEHPNLRGRSKSYKEFPAGWNGGVILHYSLGSPLNALYSELTSAERMLVFHNLTPPHWFAGVNPRIVSDISQGLDELPRLCRITDRLIADSRFNASELEELGFKADVLELPIDPARWTMERNPGIYDLVRSTGGIDLLHVGRLAPNKKIEDIIKTFYFLHHHIEPNSRLWLVGIDIDTEIYSFALKDLTYELRLDDCVNFVGCLVDSEVRALYEACSAYLCMSEHEGFCLPVVEAMHFGLPVLAYASSALPETIRDGGILFKEKRFPEIAELINLVATDGSTRTRLQEAGKRRAAELSYDRFAEDVRGLILGKGAMNGQGASLAHHG